MKVRLENQNYNELCALCDFVRVKVSEENYDLCEKEICVAMENYPHAPQPHNLMGIVLEKKGDHASAMKHFRAAWALDSTYLPAKHNLKIYGTFFSSGSCAFDESDVPPKEQPCGQIVYDHRGVGYYTSKNIFSYDHHGIGHVAGR